MKSIEPKHTILQSMLVVLLHRCDTDYQALRKKTIQVDNNPLPNFCKTLSEVARITVDDV